MTLEEKFDRLLDRHAEIGQQLSLPETAGSEDFARQGRQVATHDVLEEILVRDRLDSSRSDAPLRQAEGSYYLDTTGLLTDDVVERLLGFVRGVAAGGSA